MEVVGNYDMKDIGLISIIIPVYNSEQYLAECLDSIIAQTYTNIEIVLVNDGSTDNSLAVLEKYQKTDNRIKIINQPNAGVTIGRKNGVFSASGKWILFSDSDDTMPANALETLANMVLDDKTDIVIGHVAFTGSFKWPYREQNRVYSRKQYLKALSMNKVHCGPVSKLIKASLFTEKCFSCPKEIVCGEDKIMNMLLGSNANKIVQIKEAVYNYIQRPSNHPSDLKNRKLRLKFENSILGKQGRSLVLINNFVFIKTEMKNVVKTILGRKI